MFLLFFDERKEKTSTLKPYALLISTVLPWKHTDLYEKNFDFLFILYLKMKLNLRKNKQHKKMQLFLNLITPRSPTLHK